MPEMRKCQNCHAQFTIAAEDFDFYKKIDVPPPTFCPSCRYQRRLMTRNERNMYKRECSLCKKSVVSMYSSDKQFPAYCSECWWGDGWDAMQYGAAFDPKRPFFEQFKELLNTVPRPNLRATNTKNSDYCNYAADVKGSYLCFGSIEIENCLYGSPYEAKYCVDTYLARESEYCYQCIDCEKLSNCAFCQDCSASINLLYCFDCKNCQDCIGSVGLRNKQYHIFNKPFTKEEYIKERERITAGGDQAFDEVKKQFEELKNKIPHRFSTTLQCVNVTGDHIVQSKNAKECFDVKRAEDTAYCVRMIDAKDTHDTNYCEYLELCYDYLGFWKMARSKFSNTCGDCSDLTYCDFCSTSSNCFGCVGLRNKKYCILNVQYEKGEYEKLVKEIRQQMEAMPFAGNNGRVYKFGEFFPGEIAPVAYNESVAQDFFPLTKEEVVAQGFVWKEPEARTYTVTKKASELPITAKAAADSILKEVIGCSHEGNCKHQCTTAFKLVPAELEFYRRMQLPLPQLCPNCRHYERLAKRNPLKLWHRQCNCDYQAFANTTKHRHHESGRCPNEFETAYSLERPEIVYCEQCYQAEII